MAMKSPASVKDLRGARYNPRTITPTQLKQLQKSLERFGDLSGTVFNLSSQVLVSGHQRMKTTVGKKTKLVRTHVNKKPDSQGTVSIGYIEVYEDDESGSVTKIPYREVFWKDKIAEMAANVAANASGGEFDQAKLGAILEKVEQSPFGIEATGVDNFTAAKAIGKHKKSRETSEGDDGDEATAGPKSAGGKHAFDVIDPEAMDFDHCCPKCGYQWSGDTSSGGKATAAKPQKKRSSKSEPEPLDTRRERVVTGKHKPSAKPKTKIKAAPAKPVKKVQRR